MAKNKNESFDKYKYYIKSVQSPDTDVDFFYDTYKEIKGKKPITLREDFCGTFAVCCEWVKKKKEHQAIGVDLDPEPLEYGKKHYFSKLNDNEKKRVSLHKENVLNTKLPKADILAACNFSYFIFKERAVLKDYFAKSYKALNDSGIMVVDLFGGSQCQEANEEVTDHGKFTYYWDQDSFDPVTNEAQFYIHFKLKGGKKIKRAFSYDWRMWSIPELRDIFSEVGFSKTHVYWEGTDKDGEGNGEFTKVEKGEECESWVAYIVAEK